MSTSPATIGNVLRLLGAAFPTFPLDENTLGTYVTALSSAPLDAEVLNAAAVQWVANEDRYPTVHQLTQYCQIEARRRAQARADAEAERVMAQGGLPGVALDPGYAVEMVDVVRTALERTQASAVHRHPGGDPSTCPTCSRAEDLAAEVAAFAVTIAADRGLRPPPGVDTFLCPDCRDLRFVTTEDAPFTVRPCGRCSGPAYERWIDGHLMPNHTCGDCRSRA